MSRQPRSGGATEDRAMSENGYLNEVVEATFNRLVSSPLAEEIGLFGLEEECTAHYRAGMTPADLVRAVRDAS